VDWRLAMRSAQLATRAMAQAAALFQRTTASRIVIVSALLSLLVSV
jgi:hypothetical protein